MDTSNDYKLSITRLNMISVGRMAIKTLIDKSCFESIDDTASEVINFCNIVENMFYFCVKCAEAMHSKDSRKHPWHLIKACFGSCNLSNCIPVIAGMETLKHNFARLRAWIRYALLEKKLYDYLLYLHRCQAQILKFYTSNCVFICQEYQHFINSLLGLKAIDFSIDLKGENLNHFGFYPIDFTPYLQYVQNPLSVLDDLAESCNHDSDSGNTDDHSSILSSSCHWKEKFSKIEKKLKNEVEQKGYLEEMLRVQEDQVKTMEAAKRDAFLEMKQLENVVLELQIQLTLLHEQYSQELAILDSGRTTHLPPPSLSSISKSPPNLSALNEACSFSASDEAGRNAPPPKINANGRNVFESSLEDSHSERLRMVQPGILILPTEKPFKVGRQELDAKDCYLTPSRRSRPNQIKEGPTCEEEANLISLKAVRFSDGTDSSEEERVDEGEDVLRSDVFLKSPFGENNNNKRPVCSPPPVCQNGAVDSPIRLESSGGSPDGSSHHNSTFNSETFDSLEYDNIDTPEVVRRARRGMESHYYQLIRPISLCHEDSEVNNDAL